MRLSRLFVPTLKEVPSDAEIPSHQLMIRSGMIRKVAPGIYTLLPIGLRVVEKVSAIIREEMNLAGGQELLMPLLSPAEPWQETGRWADYGEEMWKVKDRNDRWFCLAPTHEEVVTGLVRDNITSYRQLPLLLYHIGEKFRDEIRPRFGVMRGREFMMKDLYSFDTSAEGLELSYRKMYDAYTRIFERCGLRFRAVVADSGAIGGSGSHEFTAMSDTGESEIVYCEKCGFAASAERAELAAPVEWEEEPLALERVATPSVHTITELVEFLPCDIERTAKILFYRAKRYDGASEIVAAIVAGNRELNDVKLKNLTGALEIAMADPTDILMTTGAPTGSAGPIGLRGAKVYIDREVAARPNLIMGANEEGFHMKNVNLHRDYEPDGIADLITVTEGDPCPDCGNQLSSARGIEVGQVFKLWTKYSEALHCVFADEAGELKPMQMGCYGIGITRTVAAIIEQHHDELGIIWPAAVAPYQVVVTCINVKDDAQLALAESIYRRLSAAGIEVVLDDRDERAGVKFKDADLIGFPYRINVGKKASAGIIELVERASRAVTELPHAEAILRVAEGLSSVPVE